MWKRRRIHLPASFAPEYSPLPDSRCPIQTLIKTCSQSYPNCRCFHIVHCVGALLSAYEKANHQRLWYFSTSYFEENGEDPSYFELEELEKLISARVGKEEEENTVPLEIVANKRKLLRKQLEVVCRMLSDAVLQNSTAFQDELTRVIELQNSLKEALDVASSSRR